MDVFEVSYQGYLLIPKCAVCNYWLWLKYFSEVCGWALRVLCKLLFYLFEVSAREERNQSCFSIAVRVNQISCFYVNATNQFHSCASKNCLIGLRKKCFIKLFLTMLTRILSLTYGQSLISYV